ncbi:MAG: TetR/AcrR family transcriptional regulator [Chromatiales bacterium]|nr:TetR/AcrR family transcriptional regulator [Chromatiales bacterium]
MATRNPQQTRERLLQTAFAQMHAHGFQGMRVDEVLKLSGLQKGAFYHHFNSKADLGYAVLEEQIKPMVESVWLAPFANIDDPVQALLDRLDNLGEDIPPAMREHGCPLNNLAQEMSKLDEGFRVRIATLFRHWVEAFAAMFEKGKQKGFIRPDVDSQAVSRFVIAALEGCIGVYKVEQAVEQWFACRSQLAVYLSTLRPNNG